MDLSGEMAEWRTVFPLLIFNNLIFDKKLWSVRHPTKPQSTNQ
jgi:hypothetical protein